MGSKEPPTYQQGPCARGKSCAVYDPLGALLGRRGSDKHHFLSFCPVTVANPGNHPSHRILEAFCPGVLADFPRVCLIASGAGELRTKGQVWQLLILLGTHLQPALLLLQIPGYFDSLTLHLFLPPPSGLIKKKKARRSHLFFFFFSTQLCLLHLLTGHREADLVLGMKVEGFL